MHVGCIRLTNEGKCGNNKNIWIYKKGIYVKRCLNYDEKYVKIVTQHLPNA